MKVVRGRDQPFIPINCGRFSTEHLQSELFGHEVGAFTSAICQCRGTFEIVDGGILFLTDVARYNQFKKAEKPEEITAFRLFCIICVKV